MRHFRSTSHGFALHSILLVLLLVAVIGLTGWRIWESQHYKGYTNKEIGIGFRYPKTWGTVQLSSPTGSGDSYTMTFSNKDIMAVFQTPDAKPPIQEKTSEISNQSSYISLASWDEVRNIKDGYHKDQKAMISLLDKTDDQITFEWCQNNTLSPQILFKHYERLHTRYEVGFFYETVLDNSGPSNPAANLKYVECTGPEPSYAEERAEFIKFVRTIHAL